jgi:UDP-N-acetylglucosamine diphosphorylase / glucose-1-phosphate thymidylyltransferase / UDP-N-acetylgalactosamine diphosphorylase / glucosamine-1-phosphate N-acetyltransferase / galactosamine-1-phosphate N-acetyltransferase
MRKAIVRDKRKIPPFNEPARELPVLNKPLWLHQKDILDLYCDSEIEVDFLEQIPDVEYEETLVYRDNLFFDEAFVEAFLGQARAMGKACRVAFALDDEVITRHALPLQSGIRREGNVYVAQMWYYPRGLEEMTRPLVIDCGAYEFGSYRVPTHMSTQKGDLVFQIPLRAFLCIENWVHVYVANCLFGVLAKGARMERSLNNLSVLVQIMWRSLLERKQILSCSHLVKVGRNSQIDPTAVIQGPTVIGDNVYIGAGVVISNCIIGNHASILHGNELLISVIGDRCYLPFRASLFMSTVMEDTIVAQNACLQFCVVGRDSFIGAGTTFTDFNLIPKPLRTMHGGELQEVGMTVLGGCVGHHCRIGADLTIYPARTIESDVVLARSDERAVIANNVSYEESDHLNWPDAGFHPRLYPR